MNRFKRIFALLGVILLVLLYISTLVFALIDHPLAQNLLMISLAGTIFIPVILYAILMFDRLLHPSDSEEE